MRQLVVNSFPSTNERLKLQETHYNYLINVLRLAEGSEIEVRLPDGTLISMYIETIQTQKKQLTLRQSHTTQIVAKKNQLIGNNQPALMQTQQKMPQILLFQWLLKGQKMDLVIRQATEAGVVAIIPVIGERCITNKNDSFSTNKKQRWERIIREAQQQSGSPIATQLYEPIHTDLIEQIIFDFTNKNNFSGLVFTEMSLARKTLHEYLYEHSSYIGLAIGPEGGMSKTELQELTTLGFGAVHFKTNILRAETASLYSIAAVQTILSESETWQLNE